MKISFLTTWNTKCGIADYSKNLLSELEKIADLKVLPLDRTKFKNRKYLEELASELNQGDLAHIQHTYSIFGGEFSLYRDFAFLISRLRVPFVITLHEVYYPLPFLTLTSGGFRLDFRILLKNIFLGYTSVRERMNLSSFRKAARLIVHNSHQAKVLRNSGILSNKVLVLPHGIPDFLNSQKPITEAKKAIGVEGKTVMTIFGFVNWRKGCEITIQALKKLPDNVMLIIAGDIRVKKDANYLRGLKDLIKEADLSKRVIFTGYLSPELIPDYFSASDLILAPAVSGAGSGSLSLAIAYGKPIVASDTAVNREIVNRIPCLEIFRSADADDLYNKIRHLLKNGQRRKILSINALEYAKKFSYLQMARKTKQAYLDVLK